MHCRIQTSDLGCALDVEQQLRGITQKEADQAATVCASMDSGKARWLIDSLWWIKKLEDTRA